MPDMEYTKSDSLNRTSVGLKPYVVGRPLTDRNAPQSNQRGIETAKTRYGPSESSRLNRTSVGLKRVVPRALGCLCERASIEPAWD